jgi:hypothetical protein
MSDCAPTIIAILLICILLVICAFGVGLRTCRAYLHDKFCGRVCNTC